MLILVAVTVNLANENGGLFVKTREAKQDTAYKAEEENLATYMYGEGVYDAIKGEVNLDNLKASLDNSGEWGTVAITGTKLTVIGKQSGEEHIVNSDGTIGEKKESEIVGKKFYVTGEDTEYGDYIQFNSDLTLKNVEYNREDTTQENVDNSIKYTYDSTTKKGKFKAHYEEDGESWDETMEFDYVSIKDESGNEVNQAIVFGGSVDCHVYATNKNKGLVPLGESIYVTENETIKFGTANKNGEIIGTCDRTIDDGNYREENEYYVYCNGNIYGSGTFVDGITINSDYTEITLDGNVYTKQ